MDYVVLNENTLGYVYRSNPSSMGVLAGSVLRGGHNPLNGPVALAKFDRVRKATPADFHAFRVDPKGHLA